MMGSACFPARWPWQQSHLTQLASWMLFRHTSRVLEELLGVYVSSETARLCEEVGQYVEEKQTAEAKAPVPEDVWTLFAAGGDSLS